MHISPLGGIQAIGDIEAMFFNQMFIFGKSETDGWGARDFLAGLLIVGLTVGLHAGAWRYPLVFSDVHWFGPANMQALATADFGPRYLTKKLAYHVHRLSRGDVLALHLLAVTLHALVGIMVWLFMRRLVSATAEAGVPARAGLAGLIAAVIFVVHPAQVYAVAYVSEQELVLATLFALFCLLAWLEGVRRQSPVLLWCGVAAYAGAMLSKETLIMVPALVAAMTVLIVPMSRALFRRIALPMAGFAVVALATVGMMARVSKPVTESGHATTQLAFMAGGDITYWQSAMTQTGFFFRYGAIWLFPDPARMAIDIQLPLVSWPAEAWGSVGAWIGVAAFLLWPMGCLVLLARRGWGGLVGFGLLWPWLLFLTEFATIRGTEAFVLYRMYPWVIGPGLVVAIAIAHLARRVAVPVAALLIVGLFILAHGSRASFASAARVWDQAVVVNRMYETTSPAAHRAYVNRGNAHLAARREDDALRDFRTASRLAPNAPEPALNTAVALARMGQLEQALAAMDTGLRLAGRLSPSVRARAHASRAAILVRLDRAREALADLDRAMSLDPDTLEYRDSAARLRDVLRVPGARE